jgi:membrane protease YdiL (CAAX protease family)
LPPEALNQTVPLTLAAIAVIALALTFYVYPKVIGHLRRAGGQVQVEPFALPELLISIVLASALAMLLLLAVGNNAEPATAIKAADVLPNSLVFVIIVAGIAGFLRFRGMHLPTVFGLPRVGIGRVFGWALVLLLGAYPVIAVANALGLAFLGKDAAQQPLVELFRQVAQQRDYKAIAAVVFAGVVIAPVCEEFLFRGFFYPVGKRYVGVWVSALLGAGLFAAMHGNLASLPGLFVLAGAFTLAYERTGSLLVPICMHALFNATNLGLLYLHATGAVKL